ncbi:MAG: xanthine dehydrogenase family protein molybdopterin-binding subunit, partial [Candidatus Muiribacteriota bacterium]
MKKFKEVNKSVKKIDGLALATGEELFTDDFTDKDTLIIKLMPSPHAYAEIIDIDASKAMAMEDVVDVLSFQNVERIMYTTAGQSYPEPAPYDCAVFDNFVRFTGDKVCAVVAKSEKVAVEALKKIKVKYNVLEPVLDFEKSEDSKSSIVHSEKDARQIIPIKFQPEKNIASEVEAKVGDVKKGFNESEHIDSGTFYTQYAHHCPIEPSSTYGYFDPRGRLVIITATQVPFHTRRIIAHSTGIPLSKIRVIKPRIGGGFGNKQEALLESIVAVAVWKHKQKAKLILKRDEMFVFSRTRHPFRIKYKVGYDSKGEIKALHFDALQNTGAYGTHALTVTSCVGSKILPLLNKIPNIFFTGKAVYTNLPAGGAYRGYGATQGYFAYSQMIDDICEKLNINPTEYYKKWHMKKGETSPIFAALGEGKPGHIFKIDSCALSECIDKGAELINWDEKRKKYHWKKKFNYNKRYKKGIGMGCFMQGSSVPYIDMGAVYMKMNDDGSFNLNVGATDLGTGSDTVLSQIAAEMLEINTDDILILSSDTDLTPFDVGAYASSTTYLSGLAVKDCAAKIKNLIIKHAACMLEEKEENIELFEKKAYIKGSDVCISYADICTSALHLDNLEQIQAVSSRMSTASPPP